MEEKGWELLIILLLFIYRIYNKEVSGDFGKGSIMTRTL